MKLKCGVFEMNAGFKDLTWPQISSRMEYIVKLPVPVTLVACLSVIPQPDIDALGLEALLKYYETRCVSRVQRDAFSRSDN